MRAIPLSSALFFTIQLGLFVTGSSAACQTNCCEEGYSCCGATCVETRRHDPEICASIDNGCCRDPANNCATDPDLPTLPPTPATAASVRTDGSLPPNPPAVVSSNSSPSASSGPCQPDCCTTGSFCCGDTCSENRLKGYRDCPEKSTCCSNSLLICSNPQPSQSLVPESSVTLPPTPAESPELVSPVPEQPQSLNMSSPESAPAVSNSSEVSSSPPQLVEAPAGSGKGLCSDGCEPWWGQCAGKGYQGPGCCAEGSTCQRRAGKDYGQCKPTREVSLCPDPPIPTGVFCQCGGENFWGEQECRAGLECVELNTFYHQCRPLCVARGLAGSQRLLL